MTGIYGKLTKEHHKGIYLGIYIEDQFIMTYYAIILIIVVAYVVDKSTCFVIIFNM